MAEAEQNLNPHPTQDAANTTPSLVQPAITPITIQSTSNAPPPDPNATNLPRRPRDARLMHLVLASLGINGYQERVPLQLLDFSYRYTSSVLTDALYLNTEGYTMASSGEGGGGVGPKNATRAAAGPGGTGGGDSGSVSLNAVRLSIASRLKYQFNQSLPKEFLMDLAAERNRVALPPVGREWGIRLPPERFCLTGVGWGVRDEWESEGEGEEEEGERRDVQHVAEGEGEEEDTRMEDIFGEELGDQEDGDGVGQGEDRDMTNG